MLRKFLADETGATAIEYGLIAALIAVAMIAGATAIGDQLNKNYDGVAGEIDASSNQNTTATNSSSSTAS